MPKLYRTYLFCFLVLFVVSCKQTKYVQEDQHLLQKNNFILEGDRLDKEDLRAIIRQKPNQRTLGIKWKLMAFNSVDSTRVANKRMRRNEKIRAKNRKRLKREDRSNSRRIDRAKKKGLDTYRHKTVSLKDTVEPNLFLSEWYKYRVGRPPVLFDSILYKKTIDQIGKYLRNKGYYYGAVDGFVDYKSNKKCEVSYHIVTGDRYYIDSVYFVTDNIEVAETYKVFVNELHDPPLKGKPFDKDYLEKYRGQVARYMRDSSFYGFHESSIIFLADTNAKEMTVSVGVELKQRLIVSKEHKDSLIPVNQHKALVSDVVYHLADSMFFEGNFKDTLQSLGFELYTGQFMTTIDTLYYYGNSKNDTSREHAVILYNGELFIKPKVLDMQSELEKGSPYRERYVEDSYNALLRLGLFSALKIDLEEDLENHTLTANYYLIPSKRQSFSFEPRATNSNGFLGVSAAINYTNKNLFRGAERFTFAISGGFESQPPVFDETIEGEKIKTAGRSFNTLEIGPSMKLEIPGFFPFRESKLSKKRKPKTILSTAYNYQRRVDFTRGTFQLKYMWKFIISKTQIIQLGLPGASVVRVVNIDKSNEFEDKLTTLNDLFLLDAYSNQFIWQDWKVTYEYNIKNKKNRKRRTQVYFNTSFDPAGNLISAFHAKDDTLANGSFAINGLQYSQFLRSDNELIVSQPFTKERSINFKLLVGGGIPYGNSKTTLPYDYSFFAGGANDNRGWRARALGPGAYKYYLDTNRTATQIGDIRLGSSFEVRFPVNALFKGAFFIDAGNIWSIFEDENRPGGQISPSWYKEIAVAGGFGLRMDLEYFVLRFDLGVPLRNPALPDNARWVWQSREPFYDEAESVFGLNYKSLVPKPFIPQLHFGIGYPF